MIKAAQALNYSDYKIKFETRKPFSYSQISTLSLDDRANFKKEPLLIKKGYQTKNAEHHLLDIYHMLKSGNKTLIKIMKFMYDNNIDVIHVDSAIKTGKQGVINHTKVCYNR